MIKIAALHAYVHYLILDNFMGKKNFEKDKNVR